MQVWRSRGNNHFNARQGGNRYALLPGREYSQRAASNSLIGQIRTMNTDSRAARRVADSAQDEDQVI